MKFRLATIVVGLMLNSAASGQNIKLEITGREVWKPVTLTIIGPMVNPNADPNPFRDCRLTVIFENGGDRILVPGYLGGDLNWHAHLLPDRPGIWSYEVNFRSGPDIALSDDLNAGQPLTGDGLKGTHTVIANNQQTPGLLRYVGGRYLQFAGNNKYFIKAGADSPENFLAYEGFANTKPNHKYYGHRVDLILGPQERYTSITNICSVASYFAKVGVNSMYMLTMNVDGDGKDVWPWIKPDVRDRFDTKKLSQWNDVFKFMNDRGVALHIVTQEQENDQLLDNGELGPLRKLYYRELIARFAHHPMLFWNLGEENTNTTAQQKAFAEYIRKLDPYDHPIVIHTFPNQKQKVYQPLLGFDGIDGPSLQIHDMKDTHAQTLEWINKSAEAGRPWVVCLDEIGPANTGVKPDAVDPDHDDVRRYALWGNLMAGGAGVEWYFGYKYPNNDLNCEDFRSRENMWKQTKITVDFFQQHLPFVDMQSHDELTAAKDDYCFALVGEVYAVYLPPRRTTSLTLPVGRFSVKWFDPRQGGKLQSGSIRSLDGPGELPLGDPPADVDRDWVVLIERDQP
ncbi:DUF5060 domain-containing protein [Planctomycetales bacterium ZRK34]|nr:DUF5060 domain-containing protein [Planctomycetales bacterium ZRK34]